MAGRRYLDLVTDAETLGNLTGQRAMVQRLANDGLADIASAYQWPFLWTRSFFTTIAPYETGTVSVTNGSATITGSGTTFTAAMVGRKFRVGSQSAFYIISAFVSTTEVTLETTFQGTTASAQTYSIFQDEYLLRADVDYYKTLRQIEEGVALLSLNISEFDELVPTPEATGSPSLECYLGQANEEYTTGTVSMSSGSRTLTGASSPAWLSARGLSRGTKLRIGDTIFTVNTVDSNTQITVYEAATSAIAAGTAYTAIINNPTVQLFEIPDAAENIYYRFQRMPPPMNRDGDWPDLRPTLHPLILDYLMIYLWEYKGSTERMATARKRYDDRLAQAILRYGHSNPDRVYRKRPEASGTQRRTWPRFVN